MKTLNRITTFPRTPSNSFIAPTVASIKFIMTSFTNKPNPIFARIFFACPLYSDVFITSIKQHQVFDSIVRPIAIFMMNNLIRIQETIHMFFHYKSMFQYISSFSCKRMIWNFNQNISITVNHPSTFPSAIFGKFLGTFLFLFWCQFFTETLMSLDITYCALYFQLTWEKGFMKYYCSTSTTTFSFYHEYSLSLLKSDVKLNKERRVMSYAISAI